MYSLLLKNGFLVDPLNDVEGERDILIKDGRIEKIRKTIKAGTASDAVDLRGKTVIPGIIDVHVHLRGSLEPGFKMLARAGVTTAIDFAGPADDIIKRISAKGAPVNLGVLEGIIPGRNVKTPECGRKEAGEVIDNSLEKGALGIKIVGGHYPLTPGASRAIIEYANKLKIYAAFHAGTTATPEAFPAFKEAVEISRGMGVHIAHVNSYCRGRTKDYLSEMAEALRILEQNPNIRSDSYLSAVNGTSGKCAGGTPVSEVTRRELASGGYPPTEAGLGRAIIDGCARVCVKAAGENVLLSGEEGRKSWDGAGGDVMVCFSVNPGINAIAFALHRRRNGDFTVDALSTDGGGIPRNSIIHLGLPLSRYDEFKLADFVTKTSVNPAAMFGLADKGHLGEGADADITVLDMREYKPYMGIVSGRIAMLEGYVSASNGKLIISERGAKYISEKGLNFVLAGTGGGRTRSFSCADNQTAWGRI